MNKLSAKITEFVKEKIQEESLDDVISERFAKYSKYIIQDRALPDARDGLKPVQRRIFYALWQMGILSNKPYKKSARIVGEVMGKFHPHGDSSIYEAMIRLSQNFKMNIPLIDVHGNNGSIDGDAPAAMRYTEARMSKAAELLLKDIDKKTVPFIPNFDDCEIEPTILPTKFPNLIVNGASGISAGYATKIPPHNINEVIDAAVFLIDNPHSQIDELLKIIKGPDFPTGAIVQGQSEIEKALKTGIGKIVIRSKTTIEEITKNQDRIVITEIPYEVNKAELVRKIDLLRLEKKLEDLLEVRDESDKEASVRIAIDLKKGADTSLILNYLFKNTDLQVLYNYNMIAILNHRPVLVSLLDLLNAYLEHQKDVITNRSNYELDSASKRLHIISGLIKMLSILDEVISAIRKSKSRLESKESLIKNFNFSDLQAEAILNLQLYRLSSTDLFLLEKEQDDLEKRIKKLNLILNSEKELLKVIKEELLETKTILHKDRKSLIESEIKQIKIDQKELISDSTVYIGVTKDGYLKKSSIRSYQASTHASNDGLKKDDLYILDGEVQNTNTLLIFTNLGNYIYIPIYKLEEQKWKDLGIYLNNIIPIKEHEKIITALIVKTFKTNDFVLLTTKNGMMKKVAFSEFEPLRYNKPIRAIKLLEGDSLVSIDVGALPNIVAISSGGYLLRFKAADLPLYSLSAIGVKSVLLTNNDFLSKAVFVNPHDQVIILTSRGHIIKDTVSELPLYGRGRKGVLVVEKQKNNPHLAVAITRLTANQRSENQEVTVFGKLAKISLTTDDLKYQQNKFGKKILDTDLYGEAYNIEISKSINDIGVIEPFSERIITPLKENLEISTSVVEEDGITKDKQKIKISRLDLFDE